MRLLTLTAAIAISLSACSGGTDDGAPSTDTQNSAFSADNFRDSMSTQELMAHVVDHVADEIWLNQGWYIDDTGESELFPQDDDGWRLAENAGATLSQLANVLLLPSHIPSDDSSEWIGYAQALSDKAMLAMETAESQDKQAFFDAGGEIYLVCRSCHEKFVIGDIN